MAKRAGQCVECVKEGRVNKFGRVSLGASAGQRCSYHYRIALDAGTIVVQNRECDNPRNRPYCSRCVEEGRVNNYGRTSIGNRGGNLCDHHFKRATAAGELFRTRYARRSASGTRRAPDREWAQPVAAFAAYLKLQDVSPQTLELREYHLTRLSHEIGKPPFEVALDDLTIYITSKNWSGQTQRAFRSTLRTFYQWAVRTKKITESPAEYLPLAKLAESTPHPVPEEEYARVLASVTDPRLRLAVQIAGDLGLRRAEVAQIHIDDIKATPYGAMLEVLGKGRKVRSVPVPDALVASMRRVTDPDTGYLFPVGDGHVSPHWLSAQVTRVLPEGYSMHKLRHRALTRAYATSKDILLTAKLAGHQSVSTTQQYYVAADYSQMRAIVEGIAS